MEAVADNRWLPPSPHREEILRRIDAGQCHIQERGHNMPPLLVFEDGGVIELPKVRYRMTRRGMHLVADDQTAAEGVTTFGDVCGTVDELKGILKEKPALAASDPDHFDRLLGDASYMISRMHRRCEAYSKFAEGISEIADRMKRTRGPATLPGEEKAEALKQIIRSKPESVPSRLEEINDLAEGIRYVAEKLENTLAIYKKCAIEVGQLFESIRGGRKWEESEK